MRHTATRRSLSTLAVGATTALFCLAPAAANGDEASCDVLPPSGAQTYEGLNVVRGSGANPNTPEVEGTPQDDFIVGGPGDDVIEAGYGNDTVCALAGNDVVYGGGSGDDLHGGDGDDRIFGELLDDDLYGEANRDLLVGGHGTDEMHGGINNDWLRGGTNGDVYDGGENPIHDNDNDVASFATATPSAGHAGGLSGVDVNLTGSPDARGVAPNTAIGEGVDTFPRITRGPGAEIPNEANVITIESVVGSAFDDAIASVPADAIELYGGMGSDSCSPAPCDEPGTQLSAPFAYLDTYTPFVGTPTPDPAFVVVGGAGTETLTLADGASDFRVTATANGAPEQLATTGAACSQPTTGTVSCTYSPKPVGGLVLLFGGGGNDSIDIGSAFPAAMSVDLDGGDGSDTIAGSIRSEVMFSGNSGNDQLLGGDGGDALIAQGSGGDTLQAQAGNDQLVTSDPCQGHVFRGGGDQDVAGFARTVPGSNGVPSWGNYGINATLGNPNGNSGDLGSNYYGAAYVLGQNGEGNICPGGTRTFVGGDSEILEGTIRHDVLSGNEEVNTLWGRTGNDTIFAMGGNDFALGQDGIDTIYGDWGEDRILGGPDADTIFGNDGPDNIAGEGADDALYGNEGNDTIRGGDGLDYIQGNPGADSLFGDGNDDFLSGGEDDDDLHGGEAADILWGDIGVDSLFGDAGTDKLRAQDGVRDNAVDCGDGADDPVQKDENDPMVNCE